MSYSPKSLKETIKLTPFELAMMLLSLISVVVILIMAFGNVDNETSLLLFYIDTSICMIFMAYFFFGLYKAKSKWSYIKLHWVDFIASIPAVEPLRFARVFQIFRVIRLIRMSSSILNILLRQHKQTTLASLLVAMVMIISFSSVLILIVERGAEGASIQTAEEAIWWAIVTISTVGYGDFYPVTTIGHFIGGCVIVCGVSFFGVISGYMASIFIVPDEQENISEQNQVIKDEMKELLKKMETNQNQILSEIAEIKQKQAQIQSNKNPNE